MKKSDWKKLLERDLGRCVHCGETEAIAPNHRANRGMGGSKELDKPSNLVLLCSRINGLIESNVLYAGEAKSKGWKLSKWQEPESVPIWDNVAQAWFVLDNGWMRERV